MCKISAYCCIVATGSMYDCDITVFSEWQHQWQVKEIKGTASFRVHMHYKINTDWFKKGIILCPCYIIRHIVNDTDIIIMLWMALYADIIIEMDFTVITVYIIEYTVL